MYIFIYLYTYVYVNRYICACKIEIHTYPKAPNQPQTSRKKTYKTHENCWLDTLYRGVYIEDSDKRSLCGASSLGVFWGGFKKCRTPKRQLPLSNGKLSQVQFDGHLSVIYAIYKASNPYTITL